MNLKKLSLSVTALILTFFIFHFLQSSESEIAPGQTGVSNLYANAVPVELVGYGTDQDAMEPCISPDGQDLFFNNSNAEGVETHIHHARRIKDNQFKYKGLVPGCRSQSKDMAPSLDQHGNFYFTSLRTFAQDHKSIFVGHWQSDNVLDVKAVKGNIVPSAPFWINMDCAISAEGKTMVFSRAQFLFGDTVPRRSDLVLASLEADQSFNIDGSYKAILKNVNSDALEYAPSISANALELYFTRATMTSGKPPRVKIMLAKRTKISEPFNRAEEIAVATGFVEGPSLTVDNRELFFHKKDGDHFHIYKCNRVLKY